MSFFSGTVGTCKTVLYEMCDNTNQALGMSIITVAFGAGIALGPALGGIFYVNSLRHVNSIDFGGSLPVFRSISCLPLYYQNLPIY